VTRKQFDFYLRLKKNPKEIISSFAIDEVMDHFKRHNINMFVAVATAYLRQSLELRFEISSIKHFV
jgi:hypothetical protein